MLLALKKTRIRAATACPGGVSRAASPVSLPTLSNDFVTYPAYSFNKCVREATVHFIAQKMNIDIDNVGERLCIVAPDGGDDLVPREHLVGVAHQIFQQSILFSRQLDQATGPACLMRDKIQGE